MNKLIKELSEQAMVDVDYIRFTDGGDENEFLNDELSKMYIPDFFAERFAELIIRQCCDWIDGPSTLPTKSIITDNIKARFGVKG